jgi:hypothetical protein
LFQILPMRFIKLILIFFIGISAFGQNNTPTYTWRMHLPYNSVRNIIEVDEELYVLAEVGMYSYDLRSGEVTLITKVDGLAESKISCLGYSKVTNTIIAVYENGNIDLIKDKTILNLPGLKRASIVGTKSMNEIEVYEDMAYIATSFGVVVVDLTKQLIAADYQNLGIGGTSLEIFSLAVHRDSLFLATDEGIKSAPIKDNTVNLQNFASWKTNGSYPSAKLLTAYGDHLFFVNDSILYRNSANTVVAADGGQKKVYSSIDVAHGKLVACRREGIAIMDPTLTITERSEPFMDFATLDFQDNLWFGAFYRGLIKKTPGGSIAGITPPGPFGITSYDMQGFENSMYVTSGGHTGAFSPSFISFGYYIYEDGRWVNRNQQDPLVGGMIDFTNIYINQNSGDVWLGSFGSGLAHLKNKTPVAHYDHTNSSIKTAPGDKDVALGMTEDSRGNLWVANYETLNALVVRRPDGTWQDYNVGSIRLGEMVADDQDNIWAIAPRSSSIGIVVTHVDNDGQKDKERLLTTGAKAGGLPNNNVKAIALDKTGEIWVGTETGIAVFYTPSIIFKEDQRSNADAQQIIIDDGSDIGYLLEKEVVNDIKVDGGNRKWIATNNGAWLVKADGSQVIRHFTSKNSPLPSDIVNCIGIVPNTGEVFFGTTEGIASFRGDATEASSTHKNTLVFPNPVHSSYEGPITITGLPEDATVKITDIAGRVVYELIATGGAAVWNGRNFNGDKPQTGIYLIFSANKDDEEALVTKLLIVR